MKVHPNCGRCQKRLYNPIVRVADVQHSNKKWFVVHIIIFVILALIVGGAVLFFKKTKRGQQYAAFRWQGRVLLIGGTFSRSTRKKREYVVFKSPQIIEAKCHESSQFQGAKKNTKGKAKDQVKFESPEICTMSFNIVFKTNLNYMEGFRII